MLMVVMALLPAFPCRYWWRTADGSTQRRKVFQPILQVRPLLLVLQKVCLVVTRCQVLQLQRSCMLIPKS